MASNRQNNHFTGVEKATALLALAADKAKVSGPCLADEELAALVEGRIGEKKAASLWNHLSSCEQCYGQWLFLKKDMQIPPRGRLYFWGSIKKFRYIGTALAAAASVVVYLHLVKMEDQGLQQLPQAERHLLQDKKSSTPQSLPAVIKREKSTGAAEQAQAVLPAPGPVASGAAGVGAAKGELARLPETLPSAAVSKQTLEKIAIRPPLPQDLGEVANEASRPAAQALPERSAAPEAPPPVKESVAAWLEELRMACSTGRYEAGFWTELATRGMWLQALSQGPAEDKLAAILALLHDITGEDTVKLQCRHILVELAGESDSAQAE